MSEVQSPSLYLDLRRFPLFAGLGDGDLDRIAAKLHPREVPRRTTLILETDFPQKVCLVSSGRLRLVIAAPPKANVFIRSLGPGTMFGGLPAVLGGGFGQRMRLVCDETGVVLEMNGADFHAFRREFPQLNEAFMLMLATIASDQGSRIFELSALVARERLQAELLRLARDGEWSGGRCIIKPAPTHQTLSEQIGASREVITRTLKEMSREGLIRTETGVIEILDANKLLDLDEAATGRRMFELPPSKAAAQ